MSQQRPRTAVADVVVTLRLSQHAMNYVPQELADSGVDLGDFLHEQIVDGHIELPSWDFHDDWELENVDVSHVEVE